MMNMDADASELLPDDMWGEIFGALGETGDPQQLIQCRRVCKTWERILTDHTVWKPFIVQHYRPHIRAFAEWDPWQRPWPQDERGMETMQTMLRQAQSDDRGISAEDLLRGYYAVIVRYYDPSVRFDGVSLSHLLRYMASDVDYSRTGTPVIVSAGIAEATITPDGGTWMGLVLRLCKTLQQNLADAIVATLVVLGGWAWSLAASSTHAHIASVLVAIQYLGRYWRTYGEYDFTLLRCAQYLVARYRMGCDHYEIGDVDCRWQMALKSRDDSRNGWYWTTFVLPLARDGTERRALATRFGSASFRYLPPPVMEVGQTIYRAQLWAYWDDPSLAGNMDLWRYIELHVHPHSEVRNCGLFQAIRRRYHERKLRVQPL